jgi:glutamine amidotransferase
MIAIINYGMGNLKSIQRKFDKLSISSIITSSHEEISKADKLILPGVGHFKKGMENLNKLNIIELLNEQVIKKKVPILGICLGMQLMTEMSEEGNTLGLGWIKGSMQKFQVKDKIQYKVPHIGWNSVHIQKNSPLFKNINQNELFYFIHSYHAKNIIESNILTWSNYEYPFVSAFSNENIFGAQFHPEKSHDQGEQLFLNFIRL